MTGPFADRWNRKWADSGFDDIGNDFVYCGNAVLPREAAPCLTFDKADRPAHIWEVFGIPSQWTPAERNRLAPYRVIGSDGAGNPICIEVESGTVVLLDHEDRFHSRQFVNSGVSHLAECLLAFMGECDAERFRRTVESIDPPAMAEHSFWWYEYTSLVAEADPANRPTE